MFASVGGSTLTPAAPGDTRRMVWVRIGVVVAALAIGLVLNHLLQIHLARLQMLAQADPLAARARFAMEIRVGGLALFAVSCALGASVMMTSRRAARDLRFPPTGLWGWGATRILTGPSARRAAYAGLVLGLLLIVCSLAGGVLSWQIGTRLLACRAGIAGPTGPTPPAVMD